MTQGQEKAPTGIYVVGVGVLLVGLLSFCCSAFGIFGQSQNQEEQLRQNPFVDQRMVEAILEAHDTVFIPIVIAAVVSILIALALLIFSAFTLARKPLAVHMPIVLFAAAGWTLIDTGIALWAQTVQMDAMEPMLEGGGAEASAAMNAGMAFGMTFAVCLYGGWALVKLALFLGGAVYLRKPEVQAHFTGAPAYAGYGGGPPPGGPGGGYGGPGQGGGYGAPPQGGPPAGGQGGYGGPGGQGGGFGGPPQGGQGGPGGQGGFGGPPQGGQGGPGGQGGGFGGPPQGGQGGPPGGGYGGG
jgi:uncharacterized protein YneF (UPF0154 family)